MTFGTKGPPNSPPIDFIRLTSNTKITRQASLQNRVTEKAKLHHKMCDLDVARHPTIVFGIFARRRKRATSCEVVYTEVYDDRSILRLACFETIWNESNCRRRKSEILKTLGKLNAIYSTPSATIFLYIFFFYYYAIIADNQSFLHSRV